MLKSCAKTHERGINDRFTVRVIVAGSVAADFCAFAVAAIGREAKIVHGDEDAPLHRLQAVAHIRQRARDDHAHRIVQIRLAHLGFDIDRKQYGSVFLVRHLSSAVQVTNDLFTACYRTLQLCSTYAFTVSKASAALVKRLAAKCSSSVLQQDRRAAASRYNFNCHTALVIWRVGRRGAKIAARQSTQPRQRAPAQADKASANVKYPGSRLRAHFPR